MSRNKIGLVLVILSFISGAHAKETKDICAKYQTSSSWSKSYAVETTLYSGSELNQAVGSFSKYRPLDLYAVIFWSGNQASVIKLKSPMGTTLVNQKGEDQNGRNWSLTDSRSIGGNCRSGL